MIIKATREGRQHKETEKRSGYTSVAPPKEQDESGNREIRQVKTPVVSKVETPKPPKETSFTE